MRSNWVSDPIMQLVLAAMLPANRLAVEVADATGLRINDVLTLKSETVEKTNRPTVTESKTGKKRRIYLPTELRTRMLKQAGKVWVWPGRIKPLEQHRTRQAVYKDMMQAAAVFRRAGQVPPGCHVSPHTARKRAAVRAYQQGGVDAARTLLNHSDGDIGVTLLYALSDQYHPARRRPGGGRKPKLKQ